jgi:hypothetical protein
MSNITVNVYVKSDDFARYNGDGIQDGDMTKWQFGFASPSVTRDCKLYIVKLEESPDKYYIQHCQGPRPNGDYVDPADPNEPQPPPDMEENWFTLADIQFSDYEDYLENATFNSSIDGFTKSSTNYLFKATFDPESDDWGAPVLLTVEEQ